MTSEEPPSARDAARDNARDTLGELFNVGVGSAAGAMSKALASGPVVSEVPEVRIIGSGGRPRRRVDGDGVAVIFGLRWFDGGPVGRMVAMWELGLAKALAARTGESGDEAAVENALMGLGATLASGFAGALGGMLGGVILPESPSVASGPRRDLFMREIVLGGPVILSARLYGPEPELRTRLMVVLTPEEANSWLRRVGQPAGVF